MELHPPISTELQLIMDGDDITLFLVCTGDSAPFCPSAILLLLTCCLHIAAVYCYRTTGANGKARRKVILKNLDICGWIISKYILEEYDGSNGLDSPG